MRKQRKITASPRSRRKSKCESSGLLFFIARESLVRGRNFSSRGTPDDEGKGGRSSDEVAEQGDGDEVHLAEGPADGDGAKGSDSTVARVRKSTEERTLGG